jgi:hypothetical protein
LLYIYQKGYPQHHIQSAGVPVPAMNFSPGSMMLTIKAGRTGLFHGTSALSWIGPA